MRIRYAGTWETRDYPHRIELLDVKEQLKRAGLPAIQQVGYGSADCPELVIRMAKPPLIGEELTFAPGVVTLAWLHWPDRHKSLDAKLVFQGLEEALARCGYEVESSLRAGGRGTPIAMMVKFSSTPSLRQWEKA